MKIDIIGLGIIGKANKAGFEKRVMTLLFTIQNSIPP